MIRFAVNYRQMRDWGGNDMTSVSFLVSKPDAKEMYLLTYKPAEMTINYNNQPQDLNIPR